MEHLDYFWRPRKDFMQGNDAVTAGFKKINLDSYGSESGKSEN